MTYKQTVEEARRRAHRYQFEDGLLEIAQGGAFALIGLVLWGVDSLAVLPNYRGLIALGIVAFSFIIAAVVTVMIVRYKNKLTFPRTGMVTQETQPKEEARSALAVILLALAIAAAAIWLDGWFVSATMIVGATLTMILMATAARAGILRMQLVALLPLAISIPLAYFRVDGTLASAIILGGSGLAGVVVGILALRKYLANNPPLEDEAA